MRHQKIRVFFFTKMPIHGALKNQVFFFTKVPTHAVLKNHFFYQNADTCDEPAAFDNIYTNKNTEKYFRQTG